MNTKNLVTMAMICHDVDDNVELWKGFYWLVVQREWMEGLVEVLEAVANSIPNNGDYDECYKTLDEYCDNLKDENSD